MALLDDLRTQLTPVTTTVGQIVSASTSACVSGEPVPTPASNCATSAATPVTSVSSIGTRLQAASDALKAIPPAPSA